MSHLDLSLLGGFEAVLDGQPVSQFGADKARALLAYLAIEPRPHRRDELAALLWPDLPAHNAAHSLSQTLLRLRRALHDDGGTARSASQPFLLLTPQDIHLNPLCDLRLDVAQFCELLRACHQHQHDVATACSLCANWLHQAANLYRGDFLAGFGLRDSIAFEEWQLMQQQVLHGQAIEALSALITYHERRVEPEQVCVYARRVVTLEPWQEVAQMQLMAALAQCGQPATAVAQYHAFRRALAKEFGMTPSPEARALFDQIRSHQANSRDRRSAGKAADAAPAPPPAGVQMHEPVAAAQRRQITVLACTMQCCDAGTDSEELDEQLDRCASCCAGIIERFGGQRQPKQGAGCLIYFGVPSVQEDAARRAAHCALALAALDADRTQIGIHTDIMISRPEGLIGAAPDVARECRRLAEPGSVLVTADTERLLQGWFECRPIGQYALPGVSDSMPLFQVLGENPARNRLDWLRQTHRLTRFVGRESELKLLVAGLEKMRRREGQVITLCGESGIGKSRLIWELVHGSAHPLVVLESRCQPHFQNTSLYPLRQLGEQLLGIQPDDPPDVRRARLDRTLARYDLAEPATVWLLGVLLNLPTDTPTPETITEEQRERIRMSCLAIFGRSAAERPFVLVIEDLHWADPTTVAWLDASLDALAAIGCLTLLTYRPTFVPPWRPRPYLRELTLGPLTADQVAEMLADLADVTALPDTLRRRVVAQSDGIPLFVEELTRVACGTDGTAAGDTLPTTLRDLLWARLDRLGTAHMTAGWAAALGREFSYPVLAAVVPYAETRLQADLATLEAADLVQQTSQAEPLQYAFRHALIQEAAHAALLRRSRQAHHRRIAETYLSHFPAIAEAQPELLAEHYQQAGLLEQAVDFWLRAGERAVAQGATLEATTFFGCALLTAAPGDLDRRWRAVWGRETALYFRGDRGAQRADIDVLLELAEMADDDTRRALAQTRRARLAASQADYRAQAEAAAMAIAAAQRAGNQTLVTEALAHQITAMLRLGDRARLRPIVEQTLDQVGRVSDERTRAYAMAAMALFHFETGDLAFAARLLGQSLDSARHAAGRQLDVESQYHGHLGFVYAQLGLYAQARSTLEAGLKLAELLDLGRAKAYLMLQLGAVCWRTGDLVAAAMEIEAALKVYTATGEVFGQAACRNYLAGVREDLGDLAAAAQLLAHARQGFAEIGVEPDRFEAQAAEARVQLACGRAEEARRLTEEVWDYLRTQGPDGFSSASSVYVCVADVVEAAPVSGIPWREVIEAGYRELMARAEKISDAEWRQSFLINVSENRQIIDRWRRINAVSPSP